MIEAKHLVKTYTSKSGTSTKALNDVSLKLQKKGMVFILGKSGSGKSTLLNVLGGLDNIDSGEIIIKGKSSASFKQSHFDSYRNTYVGFIFQEYNILDDFTVGQNIALAMKLQNRKPTSEDINGILKQVDLDGLGDRKPNELSGGQKQRVAIARALIKNPQIIMADEPTGALDSATGIQIFDTLKKLSKDKLVLIVSHDREFSERYADRIIELKDGQIISDVENTNKKGGEEQSITCVGNEVIVKQDYELTSKDLKIINAFIKKNKKDIKIRSGSGSLSKSSFTNTKESNIQMDTSGFSLIKSKLPLSHAFKMGTSALKHKKVKLVMTIFLSLVSFTMLGMSATMGFYNPIDASAKAMHASNINFAAFNKRLTAKNGYVNSYTDKEDLKTIEEGTGLQGVYVYQSYDGGMNLYFGNNIPSIEQHGYGLPFYNTEFNGVVVADKETVENFYNIEGTYPNLDAKEIAIPKYLAYTFVKYGYKYGENKIKGFNNYNEFTNYIKNAHTGEEEDPNIELDLQLGSDSTSTKYKVTAIIDTGFNFDTDKQFEDIILHSDEEYYRYENHDLFDSYARYSLAGVLFTPNSSAIPINYNAGYNARVVLNMPNDDASLKKLYSYAYATHPVSETDLRKYTDPTPTETHFELSDCISQTLRSAVNTFDMMKQIFLYIGLGFVVFSGLLLANFIANSITYQRKQIGILRAIGARGHDIFKIYMSESLVVALINFVLATVASFSVITFAILPNFTKMLGGVQLFSFGIIEVLLILGVSLVSAFLATFIPVYLIAKRKPIDTIRLK